MNQSEFADPGADAAGRLDVRLTDEANIQAAQVNSDDFGQIASVNAAEVPVRILRRLRWTG